MYYSEAPSILHLCYITGCKQQFSTANELNIHLFHAHSVVEPEVCIKVEGQEWNDEENTTLMTNKMLNRRYTCDFVGCDKAYTKSSHLLRHKEDTHNLLRSPCDAENTKSARPYACTLPGCDKTYTKNSHLIRHLVETHKLEKPATKVGRLLPNFGSHLATALQQIPSSSSSPSFLSSAPSAVILPPTATASLTSTSNRLRASMDDRPYACTFPGCGWSFKRQYHLNRHIITHRINNRKDGSRNNSAQNIRSHNGSNINNVDSNDNFNNSNASLIASARNLSVARPKMESISWIVLEEDDEVDQESTDEQPTSPRRQISIEEETFSCNFPGCGRRFFNSRDLMVHYLGHPGSSGLLFGDSHLIRSNRFDFNDMLKEPPVECVLEELDDDKEETNNINKGTNGAKSKDFKIIAKNSD